MMAVINRWLFSIHDKLPIISSPLDIYWTNQSKEDNSKLICDWLRLAARFWRMSRKLGSRGKMLFTVQTFGPMGSSLAIETFASFDSTCLLPNIWAEQIANTSLMSYGAGKQSDHNFIFFEFGFILIPL
jgi:hypothetical protein